MFINLSNHSSKNWSDKQIQEAQKYGRIVDIPFPAVNIDWDTNDYNNLADEYTEKVLRLDENITVMVQGEFALTYKIVSRLMSAGIRCLAAVTKREAVETVDNEGCSVKTSVFKFEKFMEY